MEFPKTWERVRTAIEAQYEFVATIFYVGALAAGVVSAISFLVTLVISFLNKFPIPYDPVSIFISDAKENTILTYRWPILMISGLIVALVASNRYRQVKRKLDSVQIIDQIARDHHDILLELRQFTLSRNTDQSGVNAGNRYDAISTEIYRFLERSLNKISSMFQIYTGHRCHASIKVFYKGQVKTMARDQLSYNDRDAVDRELSSYEAKDNTAFEQIIYNPRCASYRCNHLFLRHILRQYNNSHERWWKYYRACLVVPITNETSGPMINEQNIDGFLCVDNTLGGFDKFSTPILQAQARMYKFILGVLFSVPNTTTSSMIYWQGASKRRGGDYNG